MRVPTVTPSLLSVRLVLWTPLASWKFLPEVIAARRNIVSVSRINIVEVAGRKTCQNLGHDVVDHGDEPPIRSVAKLGCLPAEFEEDAATAQDSMGVPGNIRGGPPG